MNETELALICKALGDENRVQIIKMLTGGDLCNLVNSRKEGKWTYYSINCNKFSDFKSAVSEFTCKTSPAKKSDGRCCCKD